MAKLTRDELARTTAEKADLVLAERRYRLSTSPFGAAPGKVVAFVGKSVAWKKRGKVPKHLSDAC